MVNVQHVTEFPFRRFALVDETLSAEIGRADCVAELDFDALAGCETWAVYGEFEDCTCGVAWVDQRGFVFFTNYESRKRDANPRATLLFPWLELERQVIVEGSVTRIPREESEAYFQSRPRAHQFAARASAQSAPLATRAALEQAMKAVETRHADGAVPRPPFWGGYRLSPDAVEFWQGRRNRLHDRLRYRRDQDGEWIRERLSP